MKYIAIAGLAAWMATSLVVAHAGTAVPSTSGVKQALEAAAPTSVRIAQVGISGQTATVNGTAPNNRIVSDMLRAVAGTHGFGSPSLQSIRADGTSVQYAFTVPVTCPAAGEHVAHDPCAPAGPAPATQVFKCTVGGATVYQATPCR